MKHPLAYDIPGTTEPHNMSLALNINERFIVSSSELSGNLQKYLDENVNEIMFRHLIHGCDDMFIMYTARLGKFVGSIVMFENNNSMAMFEPATAVYTDSPAALLAFKESALKLKDKNVKEKTDSVISFFKIYREKATLEKELAPAQIDKIIEKLKI